VNVLGIGILVMSLCFVFVNSESFLAYADHMTVSVSIPAGSSTPGCDETSECYVPNKVTIDVGGEVTWSNDDSAAHTVTSGTASDGPDGEFDSSLFMAGATFSHKFETAGTYNYFCMVHPWMIGQITVQGDEAEPISDKVKEVGNATGEKIKEAGEYAGNKVQEGSQKTGEALEKTGEIINQKTKKGENVGSEILEGSQEIGQSVGESSEKIGDEITEAGEETRNAGGCLIATATYGSEFAPQVQQLREIRDDKLLKTSSGVAFMAAFNQFYYSFSPAIADLERQEPLFKEFMKVTLTPMISSLSILNHVDMDSEQEVLGYGISLILLNVGMYIGIPVFGILKLRQFKQNRSNPSNSTN
jgi:plastocyanin